LQKEWKIALDNRPAEAKSSAMGKVDTAYYEEACINIKSLYKMLKKQICEEDIVGCLQRMMQGMIMGDYVKAMEVYVELTIGNAPWPMGVTSVGIHARAAREKIGERNSSGSGGQQAHILNNEEKRKYIHAVKRFMFFCQMKYPSDPSKMFEPGGIVNSTLTKGKMQTLLKAKYDDTMTGFIAEQPTQGLKRPTNLWIQKAPHPHAAAFTSNSAGWGKAGDR
jgi:pre-mRNA-splicing factor 18